MFKRNVHVDKVIELPFYYGFHVGLEVMPADDVYKMLKIIEANAPELAKTDPTFSQIAKDMPGFQKRGVESSADLVPIHPGLAKYMREKGVWDKQVGFQGRHDVVRPDHSSTRGAQRAPARAISAREP